MQVTVRPGTLGTQNAVITAPPSKSIAHRAVLCAGLAKGLSLVKNLEFSQDIKATLAGVGQGADTPGGFVTVHLGHLDVH